MIFQTGYFKRGLPVSLLLRQLIGERALGQISRIRRDWGSDGIFNGTFKEDWLWMTDPSQAGVGAFGDLGAHTLDLLLFLLGDTARLEAVTATFARPSRYLPRLRRVW